MYFLCPKNSIRGLKMSFPVIFRFVSAEIFYSGETSGEKIFLEHFYRTIRFVFEFQGRSLELFLSYSAHFRRYQHFRGFWQSTASSYRNC